MIKELLNFLKTGVILALMYVMYAIIVFVLTILLGTPIYFGIEYITKVASTLIQ